MKTGMVPLRAVAIAALVGVVCSNRCEAANPQDITKVLDTIRRESGLVALAAAVVSNGEIVAVGAIGERKHNSGVSVTVNDGFHLGSCTKAMTATLIAMLVDEGKVGWETTLAKVLPDIAMRREYKEVTIRHLLEHRGGLPHESWPEGRSFVDIHNLPGNPRQQRLAYIKMILNQTPVAKAGDKYVYSNAGYAILGVIAEDVTNTQWEELMRKRLFEPLGMKSAGFGAMGVEGKIDQPWQHVKGAFGAKKAVGPGKYSDNPPAIGPGGTVHCSMGDWGKFIMLHLEDGRVGGRQLIEAETLRQLRQPHFGGDYAGGWLAVERSWGGGRVYTHTGSNNQNYAAAWMAPMKRYAVIAATNQAGWDEQMVLDKAAATLIEMFKPAAERTEHPDVSDERTASDGPVD
jgi:CubicO group peptidase (beta-lactamase class C family)